MNSALLKNHKPCTLMNDMMIENRTYREHPEVIVPLHNKSIFIPQYYKKSMSDINVPNTLCPGTVLYNNMYQANSKTTNNVFSLKKKKAQLVKKHDTCIKSINDKDSNSANNMPINFYSVAKPYVPISFETPVTKNEIQNINLDGQLYNTHLNLENSYKTNVNKNGDCFNYSTCDMLQNKRISNYNMKHASELKRSVERENRTGANTTQIINHYNIINVIQVNTQNEPTEVIHKEKSEDCKHMCITYDDLSKEMETLNVPTTKVNEENTKKCVDVSASYECALKTDNTLSLIEDNKKKIIASSLKESNSMVNFPEQRISNVDASNHLINGKKKKKKKKK